MISFVPRCWWQSTRCVRLHSRKATLFRLHMKDHHSPLPPGPPRPTSIRFLSRCRGRGLKTFPLSRDCLKALQTLTCAIPEPQKAEASVWPFHSHPDAGGCSRPVSPCPSIPGHSHEMPLLLGRPLCTGSLCLQPATGQHGVATGRPIAC